MDGETLFHYLPIMKLKYLDGNLVIDLHELLGHVDAASRVALIESLSCDDEIIRHVTAQILNRWTESCYCGSSLVTPVADTSCATPLDHAWREVAKRSGEVAKREIEKLERELARNVARVRELEAADYDRRYPTYS